MVVRHLERLKGIAQLGDLLGELSLPRLGGGLHRARLVGMGGRDGRELLPRDRRQLGLPIGEAPLERLPLRLPLRLRLWLPLPVRSRAVIFCLQLPICNRWTYPAQRRRRAAVRRLMRKWPRKRKAWMNPPRKKRSVELSK